MNNQNCFRPIFPKPEKPYTEYIYDDVLTFMEEHSDIPEASILYVYLCNKGNISFFKCLMNETSRLMLSFIESDIPFFCIRDENMTAFCYRDSDDRRVQDIRKHYLESVRGNCQLTNLSRFRTYFGGFKNVSVNGLPRETYIALCKELNDAMDGEMVGIAECADGTYSCFFPLPLMKTFPIGKLLLKAYLNSYGPSAVENSVLEENAREIETFLYHNAGDPNNPDHVKSSAWILGSSNTFLKVTAIGMEFGRAETGPDGELILKKEITCNHYDRNYGRHLRAYTGLIPDPFIENNTYHAKRFLMNPNDHPHHTSRTRYGISCKRFEYTVANHLDRIVTDKIKNDPVMALTGHEDEKLLHYLNECAQVMEDANLNRLLLHNMMLESGAKPPSRRRINPIVPEGYLVSDLDFIAETAERYGLSLSAYEEAVSAVRKAEILKTFVQKK